MKASISRLESVRLMNVCASFASPTTASWSDRSTSLLKITRPGVVRKSSSCQRYSIGSCRPISPDSTWNSTSSSLRKRLIPFTLSSLARASAVVAVRSRAE